MNTRTVITQPNPINTPQSTPPPFPSPSIEQFVRMARISESLYVVFVTPPYSNGWPMVIQADEVRWFVHELTVVFTDVDSHVVDSSVGAVS